MKEFFLCLLSSACFMVAVFFFVHVDAIVTFFSRSRVVHRRTQSGDKNRRVKMSSSKNATCEICCSAQINDSNAFTCVACNYQTCKKCTKTYLLGSLEDPQCMKPECKHKFCHVTLVTQLSRAFVHGPLKKHREAVLLDRQRALIPLSQPAVERACENRRATKRISEMNEQKKHLRQRLTELSRQIYQEEVNIRGRTLEDDNGGTRREFVMQCLVLGLWFDQGVVGRM